MVECEMGTASIGMGSDSKVGQLRLGFFSAALPPFAAGGSLERLEWLELG